MVLCKTQVVCKDMKYSYFNFFESQLKHFWIIDYLHYTALLAHNWKIKKKKIGTINYSNKTSPKLGSKKLYLNHEDKPPWVYVHLAEKINLPTSVLVQRSHASKLGKWEQQSLRTVECDHIKTPIKTGAFNFTPGAPHTHSHTLTSASEGGGGTLFLDFCGVISATETTGVPSAPNLLHQTQPAGGALRR